MTGFGSSEKGGFRVEAKSLNHRFLEINVKMPPFLMSHEVPFREAVRKRFGRGKFDLFVSTHGVGNLKVDIDIAKARETLGALRKLEEDLSLPGSIDIGMLLTMKDSFITEETAFDPSELFAALNEALDGVERMRDREGGEISGELTRRAERIDALNGEIAAIAPGIIEAGKDKFREKLRDYISSLGGLQCDDARVLQEASSMVEKWDITEEATRIKSHVGHLRKTLSEGGTVGRKLDFLYQELNREVNTMASKAADYRVLESAIEMKAEIEKSREQAQNIQ